MLYQACTSCNRFIDITLHRCPYCASQKAGKHPLDELVCHAVDIIATGDPCKLICNCGRVYSISSELLEEIVQVSSQSAPASESQP